MRTWNLIHDLSLALPIVESGGRVSLGVMESDSREGAKGGHGLRGDKGDLPSL